MSVGMLLIGAALTFWVGQRAFKRRNQSGVELHKSYGSAVGSQVLERILLIIGRILMIFGGIFTLLMWFGKQAGG